MGSVGAKEETNYLGQTESQWEQNNKKVIEDFDKWLDSNSKKVFEADQYNIFEKLSLAEVRKFLKPASESGFSYNSEDEVPPDNYWYIGYDDGHVLRLDEGDSLKGVQRSGIVFAVNENESTTMIYAPRGNNDITIYNDATFKEGNDMWRWEFKDASTYKYEDVEEHRSRRRR